MAQVFVPLTRSKRDDPREMLWVNVDDLFIDENVQREVDEARHKVFHTDWDWDIAEVPTVSERKGGALVVNEGQHRVLRLKEIASGSFIWVVKRTGFSTGTSEALAAQGIAKGRRGHSALALWDLKLHAGDPYATAGDKVLSEIGLVMGANSAAAGIMAVNAVNTLLTGGHRTPAEGEALLRQTLLVLASSWPDDYAPGSRWEGTLVRAVGHLLDVNPGVVTVKKLVLRLSATSSAEAWLKRARENSAGTSVPRWRMLAGLLGSAYNKGMRSEEKKLVW